MIAYFFISVIMGATLLGSGWLLSQQVKISPHDDLPAWVIGLFSSVLLIPLFFWAGAYLVHLRIDIFSLIVGAALILLFLFFKQKRNH